jgi:hypothetical protein
MTATARRIQHILHWLQQQHASRASSSSNGHQQQQQQQQAFLLVNALWLPTLKLLVECVLLVPTADMASSCLQLITRIMQQVNEAVQSPRTPHGTADLAHAGSSAAAAAADADAAPTRQECAIAAEVVKDMLLLTLDQLGPSVYHAVQHTAALKQRRQLLRLWADAAAAVLQEAGGCWITSPEVQKVVPLF